MDANPRTHIGKCRHGYGWELNLLRNSIPLVSGSTHVLYNVFHTAADAYENEIETDELGIPLDPDQDHQH